MAATGLLGSSLALIFNRMAKENNPQALQQEVNKALNEPQTTEQPGQTTEQQSETSEIAFGQPIRVDAERINNWSTIVAKLGIAHRYEKDPSGRSRIVLENPGQYEVHVTDDVGGEHDLFLQEALYNFKLHPGHEVTITLKQTHEEEPQSQVNPQKMIDQTIAQNPDDPDFEVASPPAAEQQPQSEPTKSNT